MGQKVKTTRTFLIILSLTLLLIHPCTSYAAEVKNEAGRQEGNRIVFTYDFEGTEAEGDVNMTLTIKDKRYTEKDLHLEGDIGKVKTGKGKKIYWNVLQDFPRGLSGDYGWELTVGGKNYKDPLTGIEMVFVKGGCFQMGDTFGDGAANEKPVHEVCVDDFYIGKYEVTQGQWKEIMGSNPSHFSSCGDNCPVEGVNNAREYIRNLNAKTEKTYRLPTEAEWEYAARSGGKREKYSGGNDVGRVAWYSGNSGSKTHEVGTKAANGLGIYDMSGNVWEWCSDAYYSEYYGYSPRNNPVSKSKKNKPSFGVLRGGSWDNNANDARAAYRSGSTPGHLSNFNVVGFRLARTP